MNLPMLHKMDVSMKEIRVYASSLKQGHTAMGTASELITSGSSSSRGTSIVNVLQILPLSELLSQAMS